jgi:hypothetical protein
LLAVETTALGAMALMKSGIAPETVKAALTWLSAQKCANGTWGCTQPTILAMRALIRGTGATLKQDIDSKVVVSLNGKQIETLTVNKENSDVLRLARLTDYVVPGRNRVEVRQEPPGDLPFQVAGVYWLPKERDSASTGQTGQPIEISLECDRTQMTVDDTLTCRVRVRNHSRRDIPMAIVDLGIPPGFELDTSAFRALVRADKAAKFEVTGNQAVLYLRQIEASSPFEFACSMRAKWPLRVQAPVASVCEYYTPANRASSKPATLTVAARGANGQ